MTVVQQLVRQDGTGEVSRRSPKVTAKVVSSLDEMQMIVAIRAQVFLGRPGWSYKHTFDENDHCASHIIGFVDDEPAGTMRIRWFGEFARFERIAIRAEYRSLILVNRLARVALRLCRKKGYERAGGLIFPTLVNFWRKYGAEPCGEVFHSEYGDVIPVMGTPPEWPDIEPFRARDAGTKRFEWDVFAWEGEGL